MVYLFRKFNAFPYGSNQRNLYPASASPLLILIRMCYKMGLNLIESFDTNNTNLHPSAVHLFIGWIMSCRWLLFRVYPTQWAVEAEAALEAIYNLYNVVSSLSSLPTIIIVTWIGNRLGEKGFQWHTVGRVDGKVDSSTDDRPPNTVSTQVNEPYFSSTPIPFQSHTI